MLAERAPRAVVRFGAFEIDVVDEELRRDGAVVRLPSQPLRLLTLLSTRRGRIVSRAEIQRHLWPDGTLVDFDQGINHCIRQLRAALDDSAALPRWIETLPGRGYRFLAPVTVIDPAAVVQPAAADGSEAQPPHAEVGPGPRSGSVPAPGVPTGGPRATPEASPGPAPAPRSRTELAFAPGSHPAPGARSPRSWPRLLAAGIATLIIGFALTGWQRWRTPSDRSPPAPIRIAVLPFAAFDAVPDTPTDVAALAMTAELITQLGERYPSRLAVIAHTTAIRYAATTKTAAQIGDALDVTYLLEGSITDDPSRRRVTARLIRVRDEIQIWAHTYERPIADGDDLTVEVADAVAGALGVVLLPVPAAIDQPRDPAAVEAYHQGLYHLGKPGPERARLAVAALERAVARRPEFARAWAALAKAHSRRADRSGWTETRAAVARALALAPRLPEAHMIAGIIALYADHDPEVAIAHQRVALADNPNLAEALHHLASAYASLGRHRDAIAAIRTAATLDPEDTAVLGDVGWLHYLARDYATAERECARTLELEPDYYWGDRCIVLSRLFAGDAAGAAAHARTRFTASEAATLATLPAGDQLTAWWRRDLERASAADPQPSEQAVDHLMLGDREGALATLEQAVAVRGGWILPFLAVDPVFDPVRDDPRFIRLLDRVGVRP